MERANPFELRAQARDNSRWQPRRTVLVARPFARKHLIAAKINAFNAQAQTFPTQTLCTIIQRSHNPRDAVKRGQLRLPTCASRDRHQEWLRFLRLIDHQVPEGTVLLLQLRVLCESGGAASFSARSLSEFEHGVFLL
jgi:hypothetical protein